MSLVLLLSSNTPLLQIITAIRNMVRQHREFHALLDDAEKLRLYAQSVITKHQALDTSLSKAKSRSKHWDREAKAGAEKIAGAEKERDEAKEEAQVSRLAAVAMGDAKARAKDDLARVKKLWWLWRRSGAR